MHTQKELETHATEQVGVEVTVVLQACIQEAPNSNWGNKRIHKNFNIHKSTTLSILFEHVCYNEF
jgi:hypothetical protein